ncbi:unnamed protein product [Paramecium sonneborni]|uniref:Uncharacterized protein n=1 Tax=Paramecium sonneborni TaxID=65129 RepID=A0A8S1RI09_9CILI|nr:unnamed protein product [Paramecium sonneborni]
MKKFLNFDLQRSTYANPVLKELAQLSLLKKIQSKKLLEVAELGQRCYSIEQKDNKWLEQISECFEHYKTEVKRVGGILKQAEQEMMQIEDEFMTKEMNCYSLVSEFEMESCIKDYKLQCLNQKQKVLDRINELN